MKRLIIILVLTGAIFIFCACSSPTEPEPLRLGDFGLFAYGHVHFPESLNYQILVEPPTGYINWDCYTCGKQAFPKVQPPGPICIGVGELDNKANYKVYNNLGPSNHEGHDFRVWLLVYYNGKEYYKAVHIQHFPKPPIKCDFYLTKENEK